VATLNVTRAFGVEIMNDERTTAHLHEQWMFGWDRREGDAPFDFQRTSGEFCDVGSPDVRLYADSGSASEPDRVSRAPGPGAVQLARMSMARLDGESGSVV
jgi:hypothetical protein